MAFQQSGNARVPGQDPDRLTVRVAARGTGDDTVEFALQLQDDAGNWGPRLSPTRRMLPFTVPVGRWFRSTTVTLDFSPPAPQIEEIVCSPDSPRAREQLTCRADLIGEVVAYAWSAGGGIDASSESAFSTSFPSAGQWTIRLTVEGPGGSTTATRTLYVQPPLPPVVEAIDCHPAEIFIGDPVTCRAQVRGVFDDLIWDFPDNVQLNRKDPLTIELPAEGSYRIAVIATGPGGDSMERETVLQVVSPPRISAVDCLPKAPEIGETVTCSASVTDSNVSYHWDATGNPSTGADPVFQTSFDSEGGQIIALRIVGRAGDDSLLRQRQRRQAGSPDRADHLHRHARLSRRCVEARWMSLPQGPTTTSIPAMRKLTRAPDKSQSRPGGRLTRVSASLGSLIKYANNNPSFRLFRGSTSILFVYTVRGANGSIDTAMWMDRGAPREPDGAYWAPSWCAPVLPERGDTLTCGRIGSIYHGGQR